LDQQLVVMERGLELGGDTEAAEKGFQGISLEIGDGSLPNTR
jgi:hypothetical protein